MGMSDKHPDGTPRFVHDCPYCGAHHNAGHEVGEFGPGEPNPEPWEEPQEGDIGLCIECGEFGAVDRTAPGNMRKLTDDERIAIYTDGPCRKAREAWLYLKHKREAEENAK